MPVINDLEVVFLKSKMTSSANFRTERNFGLTLVFNLPESILNDRVQEERYKSAK